MKTNLLREQLKELLNPKSAKWSSCDQLLQLAQNSRSLDLEYIRWSENPPEHFRYQQAAWIGDDLPDMRQADALPGRVDVYRGPWQICLWNMTRCSRLELNCLIIRCLAHLHGELRYQTLPEYEALSQKCVAIVGDMVASIPYQLGWFKSRSELLLEVASFACGIKDADSALAACGAIMPLARIQEQDFATEQQRTWAKCRLVYIGSQYGIRQASRISQVSHIYFSIAYLMTIPYKCSLIIIRCRLHIEFQACS